MDPRSDLTGQTFGRLSVVGPAEPLKPHERCWTCRCECGGMAVVSTKSLRSGNTRSCGCLKREAQKCNGRKNRTHGGKGTRLYRIWRGMKTRCFNPRSKDYPRYGGRGVGMCAEWMRDFSAFKSWALGSGYSDGLTIDRIDNELGYGPENCRWATPMEQAANTREARLVQFRGEELPVRAWARRLRIPFTTLLQRLDSGMPVDKAFTMPTQKRVFAPRPVTMMGETRLIGDWSRRLGVARSSLAYMLDRAPANAVFWRIVTGGKPDCWRRRMQEGDLLSEIC